MHGQVTIRRLAVAGASATVLGVAACGSATGPGTGAGTGHSQATATAPPAGAPLCTGTATVDQVVMRLTDPQSAGILPRRLAITAPPRAAALAAALCALPRMPGGMRCPAALAGALRLQFTAGGTATSRFSSGTPAAPASPGWARSGSGPGRRGPDGC